VNEQTRPTTVFGRDLRIGDVLVTDCGQRTISRIVPHPGLSALFLEPARIIYAGNWSMAILDNERDYPVIRPEP
jgi:hypothetical protein